MRGYERLRRVWNGVFDRRPAAIVRADSVPDVQRTIAVAGEAGSLLAVRCDGHSFPGFSTCDDGIVLDLSRMNWVVIDPDEGTAEVGGGALLGDIDRAASPYGLVIPAGVVSHTGAAGLTLGGGMGWLSRRLGLTIDSLLAAEVCLADGGVVRVSEAEDAELFWGLRGGGGNFGVVTRFELRLHQLGPVLIGNWIYPASQTGGVLTRYIEAASRASRQLSTAFTATAGGTRVTSMWSGSKDGAHDAVETYGKLGTPSTASLGGVTFLELQSRSDDHFAWVGATTRRADSSTRSALMRSASLPPASPRRRLPTARSTSSSSAVPCPKCPTTPRRTPGARLGFTGSSSPSGTTPLMTRAASPGAAKPRHSCQPFR